MAHLLGSEYCIESLRCDIIDLQSTVIEVVSRVGRVPGMSWKFPDRVACELDIPNVLENYDFTQGDAEANQISHIVLLELVIDRFSLLVQTLTRFSDSLVKPGGVSRVPPGSAEGGAASASLGIAVRKHWNKMGQLASVVTQLNNDLRLKQRKISELEASTTGSDTASLSSTINDLNNSSASTSTATLTSSSKVAASTSSASLGGRGPLVRSSQAAFNPASEIGFKACQTLETSFRPCEACFQVQKCLKDVSRTVTNLCKAEGLPLSLTKYLSEIGDLADDWLTVSDLDRWRAELLRDLTRLAKHFTRLSEDKKQLEVNLRKEENVAKERLQRIDAFETDLQAERAQTAAQRSNLERQVEKLSAEKTAESKKLAEKSKELVTLRKRLECDIADLRTQLNTQKTQLSVLDRLDSMLAGPVDEVQHLNSEGEPLTPGGLEERIASLQHRLTALKSSLSSREEDIVAEKSRADSLARQSEMLQTKQTQLIGRMEELVSTNEELQDRVDDLEDEREAVMESMKTAEVDRIKVEMELKEQKLLVHGLESTRESLAKNMREMEEKVSTLEMEIEKSCSERRLLLDYPDLNGPVNTDYRGTGNIALDMSNQVEANALRVKLLEEQNTKLRSTLNMLNPSGEPLIAGQDVSGNGGQHLPPIHAETRSIDTLKTWNSQSVDPGRPPLGPSIPAAPTGPTRLWDTLANIDRPTHEEERESDPPVRAGSSVTGSSVRAYKNIRDSGYLERQGSAASTRSGSARRRTDGSPAKPPPPSPVLWSSGNGAIKKETIHTCAQCGKVFKRKEDVEIHKPYCKAKKR